MATTIKKNQIDTNLISGWTPADETWTYASASTITVPSGAASKYAVGDRIKWTQTTVKYGVIVTVADTLLTIAVNTDFVVTNAAITVNYYSHEESPIGFPHWFALAAPSLDVNYIDNGSGGQATISETRYSINGRTCTVHMRGSGVKAGTNNAVLVMADSAFPLINRAKYTNDRTVLGAGQVYTTTDVLGVMQRFGSANGVNMVFGANITDNTTIADFGFTMSYEI